MQRKLILISLLFLLVIGCQSNQGTNSFDFEKDTPEWLKTKIDSISENNNYMGAKVYRYTWQRNFVYHIEVPIRSCLFCELYDQKGSSLTFNDDEMFKNFLEQKHDEVLIWERKWDE